MIARFWKLSLYLMNYPSFCFSNSTNERQSVSSFKRIRFGHPKACRPLLKSHYFLWTRDRRGRLLMVQQSSSLFLHLRNSTSWSYNQRPTILTIFLDLLPTVSESFSPLSPQCQSKMVDTLTPMLQAWVNQKSACLCGRKAFLLKEARGSYTTHFLILLLLLWLYDSTTPD